MGCRIPGRCTYKTKTRAHADVVRTIIHQLRNSADGCTIEARQAYVVTQSGTPEARCNVVCRANLTTPSNVMKSKVKSHVLRWTSLQAQWCTTERSFSRVADLNSVAPALSVSCSCAPAPTPHSESSASANTHTNSTDRGQQAGAERVKLENSGSPQEQCVTQTKPEQKGSLGRP